jgi:hypothetical protein
VVVHTCNPSYLRGRDQKNCCLSLGKKLADPILANKLGMAVHTCHPSYVGGIGRRIASEAGPKQKSEILSEK